jgi:hypothetical protein
VPTISEPARREADAALRNEVINVLAGRKDWANDLLATSATRKSIAAI